MSVIEIDRVIANIKNKIYSPIYFFMGEETYYIDYLTKFCDHNILDEEQKNFNKTVFYSQKMLSVLYHEWTAQNKVQ